MGARLKKENWQQSFVPHDYQRRGINMLASQPGGCGLLLDPGMGKTALVLQAYVILKEKYPGLQMLVIAPINPMYGTWPAEIEKWAQFKDLKLSIVHGTPAKRLTALGVDADIYIVNPEGLKWLFSPMQKKHLPDWSLLCVDESTKFKKASSKRFKVLKPHLKSFIWRWILTGTIAPNGLEDLYGQVYIMDLGKSLGAYVTHFRIKYFYQTGFGGYEWTPKEGATEQVMEAIDSRVLQLKAEDYLEMPDFKQVKRKVKLGKEAYDVYQAVEKEFIHEMVGGTILAANKGAASMKCRQIANGAVYDEEGKPLLIHNTKLDALQDIMEETNGHPLLIMYEFKHDRDRIKKYLGTDCVCITGMKGVQLTTVLDKFNAGRVKYLLMHPQAAHGMNIQKACNHIVWFSIIWDLELFIQANTRLYRQGQSSPSVMCYMLTAESTIDEIVAKALSAKTRTQASIETALRTYCGITE